MVDQRRVNQRLSLASVKNSYHGIEAAETVSDTATLAPNRLSALTLSLRLYFLYVDAKIPKVKNQVSMRLIRG